MDFEGELKSNIVTTLGLREVNPEDLAEDTFFFDGGLGLDSIDILELAVMVEEDFITIGTLAEYIRGTIP
jgi:acyl carrier protein